MNSSQNSNIDPDFQFNNQICTNYYSPSSFSNVINKSSENSSFSLLHNNVRSLPLHIDDLQAHLLDELNFEFDIIGISETKLCLPTQTTLNLNIPGYNFEHVPTPLLFGGVGMYINDKLQYTVIEKVSNEAFQALWVEIHFQNKKNVICGIIYRQHNSPNSFLTYFDEALEKYSDGKSVYILGDFNLDLLKSESCNYSHNFLLSLQSCHFVPTIDKPTRVHRNSATLIDNIFTNSSEQHIVSGNIISDISDHFTQFCISTPPSTKLSKSKKKIRSFSNFSEECFLNELSNIDFSMKGDIDQIFNGFYKKVNKLINKHAPLKKPSKRTKKQFSKPWITKGIKRSIKIKNNLFAVGDRNMYKLYRNKLANLIRLSKKLYLHDYFSNNINNIKRTWQGINSLISNNTKSNKTITCLKDEDTSTVTKDNSKLASVMNKHFVSIGQKLASQVPDSTTHFSSYLRSIDQRNSFFFTPITEEEVEREIIMTPYNKSYGLYSFPITLLKCAKHLLKKPLTEIFNTSILNGKYPSKLKISKITPIFKAGDETDPDNYRPISLLSNLNRIFEKLMYVRLIKFINKHNLLDDAQYGFRSGTSTNHAILDIISTIQQNMDNKLFSCAVFIDLKKAFDTVNHQILLKKLDCYGIRGIINDWFKSYLLNRTQTTEINNFISTKDLNPLGVPQGSVLGPLLFLLYINDITKASTKLNFFLFADDTNLLYANKSLKVLESTVNTELSAINEWLTANKLTLNIKKSNFVIFRPHQRKITSPLNIKLFNNNTRQYMSLENKDNVKYLGLIIDSRLSWRNQIDYISSKISKTVGLFAKLRHSVPQQTMITLYWSLIHPYLNYGILAWGQASKSLLNKILLLQKRVLRFIFFANHRDSAIPLFIKSNIPPLNMLYCLSVASLVHDVVNEKCPKNLVKLLTSAKDVHSYNTRFAANNQLYTQPSRLKTQFNSFSRTGTRLWNSIPNSIRCSSKRLFKKTMKKTLFLMLQNEESYFEIEKAIQLLPSYCNQL